MTYIEVLLAPTLRGNSKKHRDVPYCSHSRVVLCASVGWLHDGSKEGAFQVREELSEQVIEIMVHFRKEFFARQSGQPVGKYP